MWIIKTTDGYVKAIDNSNALLRGDVLITENRDYAKQFTSRQAAKEFQVEFSISGSIIPY